MPGVPNYLLERTVDPTFYPVTLEMCKRQCNLDIEETYFDRWFKLDDADSVGAIAAATAYVENSVRLAFMAQTYVLHLRSTSQLNPLDQINDCGLGYQYVPLSLMSLLNGRQPSFTDLMIHPVQSITSISYLDNAGTAQTLSTSDFNLTRSKYRSLLTPKTGIILPPVALDVPYPVTITMVCGYSTSATESVQRLAVDPMVRMAILALLAHWFQNREAVLVGTVSKEIESGMKSLLTQLRPLRYV